MNAHPSKQSREIVNKLKEFIRRPYAWPGGYALIALMSDGAPLCHACTKKHFRNILWSIRNKVEDGWRFQDVFINYEDPDCFCAHCSMQLKSEYRDE